MERVACAVLIRGYTGPQPHPDFDQRLHRIQGKHLSPSMLPFLTNPSLGRSEGFLYACSWALTHSWFAFLVPVFPAGLHSTLEARKMVGSNDPEEGATQSRT
jgi:hypothetical protein